MKEKGADSFFSVAARNALNQQVARVGRNNQRVLRRMNKTQHAAQYVYRLLTPYRLHLTALTQTDQFNGSQATYGYDNADRLTQLVNTANSKTLAGYQYTLDANGNRTQSVETETHLPDKLINNAQSYTYNTPKNRLTNASSAVLTYDNEGQLLTQGSTNYAYDYAHRLISQGTSSYVYDGVGNRIQAAQNGVVTKYIHDATGNLLAEANSSNQITKCYIYGHGLMAMVDAASNALYVYHFDGTGHTVAITNATQQTVNTYAYDPYGKIMAQQETVPQPFKYAGQVGIIDEGNNLYYMRARYYDANIGRFISEDPAGFAGGLNLYAYVGGNPVMLVDPSGLGATEASGVPLQLAVNVQRSGVCGGVSSICEGGGGGSSIPNFVVSPGGTAFPVPRGSIGPTPVINPAGNQTGAAFTGGAGGANGQVTTMRIMDPNNKNPSGYIKYENNAQPKAQGVDPYTGRTVSPDKAHIPIDH